MFKKLREHTIISAFKTLSFTASAQTSRTTKPLSVFRQRLIEATANLLHRFGWGGGVGLYLIAVTVVTVFVRNLCIVLEDDHDVYYTFRVLNVGLKAYEAQISLVCAE